MKPLPHFPHPIPSRWRRLRLLSAFALAGALLSPGSAGAAPPPPNLLLLVDSSGSMDYKTGSNSFPSCHYDGDNTTANVSERSRWIDLIEVLTGSIQNYDCQRLNRNSQDFKNEYGLSGNPYDFLYPNPYHRPVSGTCVAGPGTLDIGNPALFPPGAIKYHPFNNTLASCDFEQANDGVLDTFLNDARFGLMTFDTDPSANQGEEGLWSYFWGPSVVGRPAGCMVDQPQEVGVRNPSAPPWEGRAVGFGNPAWGSTDFKSRNAMIQQILLATRPYGATPIAGMLADARDYMLDDTSADPLDGSFKFGPKDDPADCREKAIILLSDGQPNMDLRPFCEPDPAGCPYDKAEDIAQDLKNSGIDIYVIGFALSEVVVDGQTKSCSDPSFDVSVGSGPCFDHPENSALQACCALNRIAAAGGPAAGDKGHDADWTRAHFADNRDELRKALDLAIRANLASFTRNPVISASGTGFVNQDNADFAVGYRFGAGAVSSSGDLDWIGTLGRSRYQCEADNSGVKRPVLHGPNSDEGDDFVLNVNTSGPDARTLYTVVGDDPVESAASIRPNLALGVDEGVGSYSGTFGKYTTAASFVAAIPPTAIEVTDTSCDTLGHDLTAAQCRDRDLKWLVGLDNGTVNQRCEKKTAEDCALIGDFYHSTPRAVPGRPNELLNDASYDAFKTAQTLAKRPAVLYASSNDGFLHAFKLAPVLDKDTLEVMDTRTKTTNELWAFVPPGVLPNLDSLYPGSRQLLLDGSPVIKDVVATEKDGATGYKFLLERTKAEAQAGSGTWRTILVQSFGAQRPGYFALDVTDPVPGNTTGPQFLWQLITDEDGNQLFGSGGATPLITTVYIGGKEVAVAVLPGGYGAAPDNAACPRETTDFSNFPSAVTPRSEVPCYTATSAKLARSLTVVRLDSGEILRTFRQDEDEVPALKAKNVVTEAPLDSPLTGQPIPFPSGVGTVADRVFIGDQDGTLWRLNFASATGSPSEWKLDLFFDGFPAASGFAHDYNDGQPIVTPPILSVNEIGNLTVAFSTGDQEIVGGATGLVNYVWSLTEEPNDDRTALNPKVNWYKNFTGDDGERVIGTMALFNGDLYFSTQSQPASQCGDGQGKLYGMHYIKPHEDGTGKGGLTAKLIHDRGGDTADFLIGSKFATNDDIGVSGVAIAQQPTCANPGTAGDDEFFANGSHESLGNPTVGKFQLLVPISNGDVATDLEKLDLGGGVTAAALDVEAPPVLTRVDSWAAIVE